MKVAVASAFLFLCVACGPALAAGPSKPNIIFVLADDLGIDGVSCYGADKHQTPHIDALAKSGLRFQTCYASPLCGPSRCLLMTGRYAFRTGGLTNQSWRGGGPGAKSADEYPMAKLMKQAGYATGQAGKWRQLGELPGDWGFDEFLTDNTAGGWYWETKYNKNGQDLNLPEGTYGPDVIQDFTVDFIRRHKDKPFFFYYAMHLVHKPTLRTPDTVQGTQEYRQALRRQHPLYGQTARGAGGRVGQAGAASEHAARLLRRQRHRGRLPQPGPWPHDQRLEREHAGGRGASAVHRKLARRDARGKSARRHREFCRSVRHLRRNCRRQAAGRFQDRRPEFRPAAPRRAGHAPRLGLRPARRPLVRARAGIQDE